MFIRETDHQKLENIFSSVNLKTEIWAYGSRVNGTAHEGSDLDLVIRKTETGKMPNDVFMQLNNKIKDSTIPFLVELFYWEMLPETFQKNIEAQHEVIFNNCGTNADNS